MSAARVGTAWEREWEAWQQKLIMLIWHCVALGFRWFRSAISSWSLQAANEVRRWMHCPFGMQQAVVLFQLLSHWVLYCCISSILSLLHFIPKILATNIGTSTSCGFYWNSWGICGTSLVDQHILEPHAIGSCALGGWIRWLRNSGAGFSSFSSGHPCAPFTICLLKWSRLEVHYPEIVTVWLL